MKHIKLYENFDSYDPYELMIIPPNKKAEMIAGECNKKQPNLNLIHDLISLGANIEWEDESNNNFTILHYSAWRDNPIIADLIIKSGANIDVQDRHGRTPLHICAVYNRIEIAKLLLDSGCNSNLVNNDGESPLHYAVGWNRKEIVKLLLSHGANPNIQDNLDMWTPLHKAMHENSVEIPKMLLDAGADTELKTSLNQTAEYIARFNGYSDIVKLINKYKKPQ